MKSLLFVALGVLSLACCIVGDCSTHAAPAPVAVEPSDELNLPRFVIDQHEDQRHAGIFIRDQRTQKTISIVADSTDCFIAFYGRDSKWGTPDIAISSNGLQVKAASGRFHWISADELVKLDNDKDGFRYAK